MRILMINQVFYPDVAATAQHGHDLARHLVAHGHDVTTIASRSIYGKSGAALPKREVVDGIEIIRVGKSYFGKSSIIARTLDFGLFYLAATLKALFIKRPDVVICFTTPPFIALAGWLLRLVKRTKLVYWVMDLYPDLPVGCGVMKPRSLVTRFFERVNRFCLRRADRTVVLGRCMMQRVRDKGIAGDHVVHIGVWSDQSEIKPIPRHENPYRKEWNLGDRFVVMYSGNFGLGHDVDTMCQAALRLRDDDSIRFLFVGGGKKKEIVDRFVKENQLENCVLGDYQPREKLDALLSCGDVHLASLSDGIEGIMVPCKLFGSMAAGRPTIFIGHPGSELARIVTERDCGVAVRNGDVDGLVEAIQRMKDDDEWRRSMGDRARQALAEVHDRYTACERWRELLEGLNTSRQQNPPRRPSVGPSTSLERERALK
jgi:colanic acid biosynthesis glycosyl transferase WcaI